MLIGAENAKIFVKVDEALMRVVVTYEIAHPQTKKDFSLVFSMDIEHTGKLIELLSECVRRIHELHSEKLPLKVLEAKAGRTNA